MEKHTGKDVRAPSHGEWGNWISVRCPGCFSRRSEMVRGFHAPLTMGPWKVVRCLDCGQMYTDPQPPFDAWEEFYPEDYPPHQLKQRRTRWHSSSRRRLERWLLGLYRGYAADGPVIPQRRVLATLLAPFLGRWVDPYILPLRHNADGSPAKLLDFGCGTGTYLSRMRALGWQVTGVDLSERAAEVARAAYDVEVIVGTIPALQLPEKAYDLVTAWQVLEHLQRPRQALAGIKRLLKPDGRLVMTVPNQVGWAARYFGPDWIGLDLPRHLSHFAPETLVAMLHAEGFRVVHVSTVCHSGWIRRSAREAMQHRRSRKLKLLGSHTVSSMVSRWAHRKKQGESIYIVAEVARNYPVGKALDKKI